jgi:Phage capsid family
MDTLEFDKTTAAFARMNEADAFIVSALARESLGDVARDPDVLSVFLKSRKSIHRSLYPLVQQKAAVTAIDLSSGLAPSSPDARAFLEQVKRVSPLGQINPITVSGNITGTVQTGNATATWAGEQSSKPVTALSFSPAALRLLKLIAQIVTSEELADLSAPDALGIVRRALISATAAAEATKLFSTDAAVAGVSPAGLLNGVSTITPAGDFANNVGQVLNALSGGDPSRPALVVSFQTAVRMQAMLRDLREIGVKVVISSAAGNKIIGIDADGLLVSEGGIDIRRGTPDLQMNDTPDSPPTASTVLISTWQRNLVALKVERWVNWTARAGAVATLTLA